jgi:HEPN domain-containing protein
MDINQYIKQWLFRADEDIATIQALSSLDQSAFGSTICFHCQQAVEKYLKAFLVFNHTDFPKTHDVDYLLNKCMTIDSESFDSIDLKNLTEFGVDIRYPDDFYVPTNEEIVYYMDIAKKIQEIVQTLLKS